MESLKNIVWFLQYFSIFLICSLGGTLQAAIALDSDDNWHFTQHGDLLQFSPDGFQLKGTELTLHTKFINTSGAMPVIQQSGRAAKPCGLFSRVYYDELWPGIDLTYDTLKNAVIRSTWELAAGARVADIRLRYNGSITLDPAGQLRIQHDSGEMRESAPIAWQVIDDTLVHVNVAFQLIADSEVGFKIGEYDKKHPLIIDPALEWNTFYGETPMGFHNSQYERASAVTVDADNNSYTAINTRYSFTPSSINYVKVIKLDSHGKLVWESDTYRPGSTFDWDESNTATDITLDSSGNIYVVGHATLDSSPIIRGPGQPARSSTRSIRPHTGDGRHDVYVVKFNPGGRLLWLTYSGAVGSDFAGGIAIDTNNDIYLTGSSVNSWSAPLAAHTGNGESDVFVQKLNSNGLHLWHTFIGGEGADSGSGIGVDNSGNIFISGSSDAAWGSPVRDFSGLTDAFAARLSSAGLLVWNTFMGGAHNDGSSGLAVNDDSLLHIIGTGDSGWGTGPVNAYNQAEDVFVVKINTSGAILWHTFIGGAGDDRGSGIALDFEHNVYITGYTCTGWVDSRNGMPVMMLDKKGKLVWHTSIGPNNNLCYGRANAIATGPNADFFIAGSDSDNWGLPIEPNSGGKDAFVAKFRSHHHPPDRCEFFSLSAGSNRFIYVCM